MPEPGCDPSRRVPVFYHVTQAGEKLGLHAAEREHCADYALAFDLTLRRFADAVNQLAGTRERFRNRAAAERRLGRVVGIRPDRWLDAFVCAASKSERRDVPPRTWHTPRIQLGSRWARGGAVRYGDYLLDPGCARLTARVDAGRFPDLGHAPGEIIDTRGCAGGPATAAPTTGAPRVQAKLRIGAPDDRFEQEADRVAEEVMRQPEPGASLTATLSRSGPSAGRIQRSCRECEEEPSRRPAAIQRTCQQSSRPAGVSPYAAARVDALRGGGHPLPASLRAFFEPRFGRDFGHVRIHTEERASESARALRARAYTVGQHIAFARGEFEAATPTGRRLLAHELVHTVQQETGGESAAATVRRTIGDGHDLRSPRFAGDPVLEAVFDDERLLRFGSRGEAVRRVQQALVDAGFPLPRFGVDGIFGGETHGAVKRFQTVFELKVDGIVGPQTMGRLDEHYATHDPPPVCPVATTGEDAVATLAEGLEAETPPAGCTVPPGQAGACDDGEVSLERDPLPIPAWDVRFVHGSTMRDVFKRPEVARTRPKARPEEVLGLTVAVEPIDTWRDAAATARLGKQLGPQCFECVLDWKLITPTVRSFIATDWAFTPEIGLWHGGPDDACPTSPPGVMRRTPVVLAISPRALARIHFAEMEHFQDFAFAFHIVSARYLATIRRLRGGRTHLRARNQAECKLKAAFFLLLHTDFTPPQLIGAGHDVDFVKTFAQSGKVRDDSGDHKVAATDPPRHLKAKRPHPRFSCFFHRRLTAASFPRVPGPTTQDAIADLGAPPLRPWHVL